MKISKNASFARRLRVRESFLVLAVSVLSLGATTAAFGDTNEPAREHGYRRGDLYRPVPAAAPDQAQIVFFRGASQSQSAKEGAHVYVNGELESALMPNDYTRFCVKEGTYSIESYIGDAPLFTGKEDPRTEISVEGGRTYFVGVSENGAGEPVPYRREDAERLLQTSHEQVMIINRASAVVPCGEPAARPVTLMKFQLEAAVLFEFGHGDTMAITPAGRKELNQIAAKIQTLPRESVTGVVVQGHADPIGSDSYNLKLSEQRAQTVGQALSEAGIPPGLLEAQGLGSEEPVVHCPPSGDRAKLIRCNAPNRRVEIHVEGKRSDSDASN